MNHHFQQNFNQNFNPQFQQQQPTNGFNPQQMPQQQQQQPAPTFAAPHLPSINNVQESVKSFTNEAAAPTVETTPLPVATSESHSEISTEVSPIAATQSNSQIARDMLLAKAKAFRESQVGQPATPEKPTHPEQLTMIDEGKQIEEARKMARDILEVPAFIRRKQQNQESHQN